MDLFTKNRTFLVMFAILIILIIFIIHYIRNFREKEGFLDCDTHTKNYPHEWTEGNRINIDGNYRTGQPERYHSYEKGGGPLKDGVSGAGECEKICKAQDECYNGCNTCDSIYISNDENCYCQFKNVREGFTAMDELIAINTSLPSTVKSSWADSYTNGKWRPVDSRIAKNVDGSQTQWKDLGVQDRNYMSLSFWIVFNEPTQSSNIFKWRSIFQITNKDYKAGQPWENKDRYVGLWGKESEPILHISSMTDGSVGEGSDDFEKHNAGYGNSPTFVVLTFEPKKYTLYLYPNHKNLNKSPFTYSYSHDYLKPPDDAILQFGIYGLPGIAIRDFKIYNQTLKQENIDIVYEGIKHSHGGILEGFSGIKNTLVEFKNSVNNFFNFSNYESFTDNTGDDGKKFYNALTSSTTNSEGSEATVQRNTKLWREKIPKFLKIQSMNNNFKVNLGLKRRTMHTASQCVYNQDGTIVNKQENSRAGNLLIEYAEGSDKNGNFEATDCVRKAIAGSDQECKEKMQGFSKIKIRIAHPSNLRDTLVIEKTYEKPYNIEAIKEDIRKANSDRLPDDSAKKCPPQQVCNDYYSFFRFSKPDVFENITKVYNVSRFGACYSDDNAVMNKTADVELKTGKIRKINYVNLDGSKKEHLEISNPVVFGQNGVTISMWIKVHPDERSRMGTINWFRLLNFGNPYTGSLKDEVVIAIHGDTMRDALSFYVNNSTPQMNETHHSSHGIRQVMDNTWHHIVWKITNRGDDSAEWAFYHNGEHTFSFIHGYPTNVARSVQRIGAPAVWWDPHFNCSIGEVEIHTRTLIDNEIWHLYTGGT